MVTVEGGCVLKVVILLWLTRTLSVVSCFDTLQCFDQLYSECSARLEHRQLLASKLNEWSGLLCIVTVLVTSVSVTVGENATFDGDRFSQALSGLVCHHLNVSTAPSFCWLLAEGDECTDCNGCVCVCVCVLTCKIAVMLVLTQHFSWSWCANTSKWYFHAFADSASLGKLDQVVSFVLCTCWFPCQYHWGCAALCPQLVWCWLMVFCPVGSTGDGSNHLFDVPILSWVCVGLGLIFSFVILTKPVWWDR